MQPSLQHPVPAHPQGWSDYLQLIPGIAQHSWDTWDELPIEAGILLKRDCICIPPELLDRTLTDLHGTN